MKLKLNTHFFSEEIINDKEFLIKAIECKAKFKEPPEEGIDFIPITCFDLYGTSEEILKSLIKNAAFHLACAENNKDPEPRYKELLSNLETS